MVQTVVILGASLAGLHVAHVLLKKRSKDLKVILVSKNTHFYWNLASVRAIIPGQIKDEDLFQPLQTALSRYPAESWELVIGTASAADFENKTVDVNVASGTRTLVYDQLVLATGARAMQPDMPWKASGTYQDAIQNIHEIAEAVNRAHHIVVGGAGGTGIEVAGELGYEYGKTKEIYLLCPDDQVAKGHGIAPAAAAKLEKLGVIIKYGARVEATRPIDGGRQTELVLTSEEVLITDLYLPTTGLIPNTEYVPPAHLSADSSYRTVLVDQYLRVQNTVDVWACGDVVSRPRAGFMITQKQAEAVAKNVIAALAGFPPTIAKGLPADIFACAIGRNGGVGRINNRIPLPSFMVWLVKGRTLGLNMVRGYIDGSVAN